MGVLGMDRVDAFIFVFALSASLGLIIFSTSVAVVHDHHFSLWYPVILAVGFAGVLYSLGYYHTSGGGGW